MKKNMKSLSKEVYCGRIRLVCTLVMALVVVGTYFYGKLTDNMDAVWQNSNNLFTILIVINIIVSIPEWYYHKANKGNAIAHTVDVVDQKIQKGALVTFIVILIAAVIAGFMNEFARQFVDHALVLFCGILAIVLCGNIFRWIREA